MILTGSLTTQPLTGLSYTNTGIVTGSNLLPTPIRYDFIDGNPSNNISSVSANLLPQIGCNLIITGSAPWQSSYGLDLSGQTVSLNYSLMLSGNILLSGGVLTTNRSSDLSRPANLSPTNVVASGIVLSGNTLSWTLTGRTLNRSFTTITTSGTAQFTL